MTWLSRKEFVDLGMFQRWLQGEGRTMAQSGWSRFDWEGGDEQKLGWEDARGLQGMWGGNAVKTAGEEKLFQVIGSGKETF